MSINDITGIWALNAKIANSTAKIAVMKSNEALLDDINNALEPMRKDGSYDEMVNRWSKKEIIYETFEDVKLRKVLITAFVIIFAIIGICIIILVKILKKSKRLSKLLEAELIVNKQLNIKLKKAIVTDKLTQLLSRNRIDEILAQEIKRSARYNTNFSLIMLDLDRFKDVNDTYGHLMGDLVLKKVAQSVKKSIRDTDYIGCWGGDEVLIVLPETKQHDAKLIAENLREIVSNLRFENDLVITASFGVTSFSQDDTFKNIFSRVDSALYEAKKEERNKVVLK